VKSESLAGVVYVQYVTSLWLCIELTFEAMDVGVFTPLYLRHQLSFVCVCVCAGRECRMGPHLDFACVTFRVIINNAYCI
jgi:hypothetical protein